MGFVINGSKTFITNPNFSDVVVVLARTESTNPRQTVSTFVIEKGNPGYKVGRKLRKLGMRASDTAELHFDNCQVNRDNLLGEMGMGFRQAMQILDGGRISIAAMSVGIAQGAYEAALKYAGEREAFGKKIAHHQSIGNKLAIMATEIEASRLLTMKAAWLKDNNKPYAKEAAMAKLYASETCVRVSNEAVQVLGGYGYIREYPVEKFFRDAKLATIGEGTSEIQKIVITRHLLEQ
jgi:alkylation response protein AidB-like acyl-CoA dehydrogenase